MGQRGTGGWEPGGTADRVARRAATNEAVLGFARVCARRKPRLGAEKAVLGNTFYVRAGAAPFSAAALLVSAEKPQVA